jgi:hypothetical protein
MTSRFSAQKAIPSTTRKKQSLAGAAPSLGDVAFVAIDEQAGPAVVDDQVGCVVLDVVTGAVRLGGTNRPQRGQDCQRIGLSTSIPFPPLREKAIARRVESVITNGLQTDTNTQAEAQKAELFEQSGVIERVQ